MFARRALPALTKRAMPRSNLLARSFTSSIKRYESSHGNPAPGEGSKLMKPFEEIKDEHDLLPPGAAPGTVPTDLEQATGLERLEILGKMQGVDIFDMRPLDASRTGTSLPVPLSATQLTLLAAPEPSANACYSRTGTLKDPIVVKSFGNEQYVGCTGCPADSHSVWWLTTSRDRPIERCPECGSVYKMEYVGPQESHDTHGHGHGGHDIHESSDGAHNYAGEPKTIVDYIRPEYYY